MKSERHKMTPLELKAILAIAEELRGIKEELVKIEEAIRATG